MKLRRFLPVAMLCEGLALVGCTGLIGDAPDASYEPSIERSVPFAPAEAGLRLLTPTQYQNSVRGLLGSDVPVRAVGQWRSSIAAAQGGLSPMNVEDYEAAALEAAGFVFDDATRRAALVGCDATSTACVTTFARTFGRRAFRRPLTAEEQTRYVSVATDVGAALGDAWQGLELMTAALLESPSFLYRVEIGEPDPAHPGRLRFSSIEMATRIAYALANTTPNEALLASGERGELLDVSAIRTQAERLLALPSARKTVSAFISEVMSMERLARLQKDAGLLPAFTPTIGPAMKQEIEQVIEWITYDGSGDYRDLFTTRETFVNDELARFYGLSGPFGAAFTPATLPQSGPRTGLVTRGGFLAMESGEASTSPTLRGKFVRTVLLCQSIPPPPPNVKTVLPEAGSGELVTKRELMARHRTDPACAACHKFMDPIGFGLENFDAIGTYRATENGLTIDPSGDVDGVEFADAVGLGATLHDHPDLGPCIVRHLYRFAEGHVEMRGETSVLDEVTARFVDSGYKLPAALQAIVESDGFRFAASPREP